MIKKNDEDGTAIIVTDLNDTVVEDFKTDFFKKSLREEIEKTLSYSIEKGIEIKLNEICLERKKIEFLESPEIKPQYKEIKFGEGDNEVKVRIYAGIGKADPNSAGWYIFCNDRLVVDGDRTNLTGWKDDKTGDEPSVQKYHNKLAMFRGAVFFDSDDVKELPMTTTKTGIDSNHSIYKNIKQEMIESMKQVFTYLNKIEDRYERDNIEENSNKVDIIEMKNKPYSDQFIFPKGEANRKDLIHIAYKKKKSSVDKVKKFFGIKSNKQVGEKTFDYFIEMEEDSL